MKCILLALLLTSCANIQKSTNVNLMSEVESVRVLNNESEATSCTFISNVKGEDNLLRLGKEIAVNNMKRFAEEKDSNAIVVSDCKEIKTAIVPVTTCSGKVFKCP